MQVVTANRLADGLVVYLTRADDGSAGSWSEWIEDSAVAPNKDEAEALLSTGMQAEQWRVVVGPYLIDVECADGRPVRAKRYRERIRALGPTVRLDLGKQAVRI